MWNTGSSSSNNSSNNNNPHHHHPNPTPPNPPLVNRMYTSSLSTTTTTTAAAATNTPTASHNPMVLFEDHHHHQLHMDAVSALTSLQQQQPPPLLPPHNNNNNQMIMGNHPMVPVSIPVPIPPPPPPPPRHYSEDYTTTTTTTSSHGSVSYFHPTTTSTVSTSEDPTILPLNHHHHHLNSHGVFPTHPYPTTTTTTTTTTPLSSSMYGTTTSSLNGNNSIGGGHPVGVSTAVVPPMAPPFVPSTHRQPSSSSSSSTVIVATNHGGISTSATTSSSTIYHPLHPNDRRLHHLTTTTGGDTGTNHLVIAPPVDHTRVASFPTSTEPITAAAAATSSSYMDMSRYHPLHPSERKAMALKSTHKSINSTTTTTTTTTTEPNEKEEDVNEDDKVLIKLETVTHKNDLSEEEDEIEDAGHESPVEMTSHTIVKVETSKPRGKPEAAARALAAAKLEEYRLQQQQQQQNKNNNTTTTLLNEDVITPSTREVKDSTSHNSTMTGSSDHPIIITKKSSSTKKSTTTNPSSRKNNATVGNNSSGSGGSSSSRATTPSSSVLESNVGTPVMTDRDVITVTGSSTSTTNIMMKREFLLGEIVPNMTQAEYDNLQEMMIQFCRVPLLSEFSRPVVLLHPEVAALYSKIITHPVDLGHVCRGIRRRQYSNCRDVRLDVWRVFANCVKYNAHPSNKEAVPSFVSIALHLRDYFNNLWQEYMLPSDPPRKPNVPPTKDDTAIYEVTQAAFAKRNEERQKRLENSGVLVLSKTFTINAAKLLQEFIQNGGRVDELDTEPLFGDSGTNEKAVDAVIQRLGLYHAQLEEICDSGSIEYTLDTFYKDLTKCYTEHDNLSNQALQNRFRCRLDRFFWKQAVPLHEANSRGVTQSSIWGNLAATIWARESSKKPFWPALCLGILPPAEQREGWHQAVTERNESRLPEKLRSQLMVAKKRCEQAQKRQSLSYFLVEFLGTHEFIWVRETDIIENFDPNNDPNKTIAGKKSRSTSSVVGSKTYATAIQECVWASEEYENVLQDAFENAATSENDEDDDEINFSFKTLAQSDDELDQGDEYGYHNDHDNMDWSDVEESNFLISRDGMFDPSMAARKGSKKRTQPVKKQASTKGKDVAIILNKDDAAKKKRSRPKPKSDAPPAEGGNATVSAESNDGRAVKNDMKDLERRRKKRLRDHEKSGKSDAHKKVNNKRHRTSSNDVDELDQRLVHDKQCRATAIVRAYLMRLARESDNKSLALNGVLTMPSASIDSIGLLGMALAFRAASGGLCMPDDGKEQLAKWKPWVVVDTERPKTAAERANNLKTKIELVEKEISRLRNDTKRREELTLQYIAKRAASEAAAEADDIAARFNHCKKRKKLTPSKSDVVSDSESPISKMSVVSNQERSHQMETSGESKEDMTALETDNESDSISNKDVIVEEEEEANDDDIAGEYDSSEAMDIVNSD